MFGGWHGWPPVDVHLPATTGRGCPPSTTPGVPLPVLPRRPHWRKADPRLPDGSHALAPGAPSAGSPGSVGARRLPVSLGKAAPASTDRRSRLVGSSRCRRSQNTSPRVVLPDRGRNSHDPRQASLLTAWVDGARNRLDGLVRIGALPRPDLVLDEPGREGRLVRQPVQEVVVVEVLVPHVKPKPGGALQPHRPVLLVPRRGLLAPLPRGRPRLRRQRRRAPGGIHRHRWPPDGAAGT